MRFIFVFFALITAAGCGGCTDDTYAGYLMSLPAHVRAQNDLAVNIIARVYNTDAADIHVRWVTEGVGIRAPNGIGVVNGVTLVDDLPQCISWVYWQHRVGDHETDAPVEVNTDFHSTAMAHEMAHCAMARKFGDPDMAHSSHEMWGACADPFMPIGSDGFLSCSHDGLRPGLVVIAQQQLQAAGL